MARPCPDTSRSRKLHHSPAGQRGTCVSGPFADYNVFVPVIIPPRQPRSPRSANAANPRARIQKLQAAGLLIIAVLVLLLTLIRYWHNIPWSAR
jgi:hypothetical protein